MLKTKSMNVSKVDAINDENIRVERNDDKKTIQK